MRVEHGRDGLFGEAGDGEAWPGSVVRAGLQGFEKVGLSLERNRKRVVDANRQYPLPSCGRHECARFCCPLSYQAKYKGKKRDIAVLGDDEAGLHTCSLPCNKILTCGVHHCPKSDHRGPCPPCLEASYEEVRLKAFPTPFLLFILFALLAACLQLWTHCHPPANSMRHNHRLYIPLLPASARVWPPKGSAHLSRD